MNRLYLSGPITGTNDYMARFLEAEVKIEDELSRTGTPGLDFDIVNPTCLPHNHAGSWEEYMAEDLRALGECNIIVMLPDWRGSKGAKLELKRAKKWGIKAVEWHPIFGFLPLHWRWKIPFWCLIGAVLAKILILWVG